jgi:hypothetical protein
MVLTSTDLEEVKFSQIQVTVWVDNWESQIEDLNVGAPRVTDEQVFIDVGEINGDDEETLRQTVTQTFDSKGKAEFVTIEFTADGDSGDDNGNDSDDGKDNGKSGG